jgi:hypothetical protein
MQIYIPKRPTGYNYVQNGNVLTTINYSSTGVETSRSSVTYNSAYRTVSYRNHLSKNALRAIIHGGPKEWRSPSRYLRTSMLFDYSEGQVDYVDPVTGIVRKRIIGKQPQVGYTACGPYISAALEAISSSNTINRLDTELLLKLKDMKINLGEALAESRGTVRMLSSTGSTFLRGLLAARRGNWSQVGKVFGVTGKSLKSGGVFSERWLEYQFGWMPLASDIHGAFDQFQTGLRKRGQFFSVQRSLWDNTELNTTSLNNDIRSRCEVQSRGKVYARVRDSDIANLTSLGLSDPLQIAWALVPYSFVVDWFIPVGNLLEGIGATRGLTFVGGYKSFVSETSGIHTYRPSPQAGLNMVIVRPFECKVSVAAYSRTPYNTFPNPGLYYKSPFSTKHLFDALALFRQLF